MSSVERGLLLNDSDEHVSFALLYRGYDKDKAWKYANNFSNFTEHIRKLTSKFDIPSDETALHNKYRGYVLHLCSEKNEVWGFLVQQGGYDDVRHGWKVARGEAQ